jgi:hypothetical protein
MTSFLRKIAFFKRVLSTLNSTFFKFSKNNLVVQRPKMYQKKICQIKFSKMADILKMAFALFLNENMSCDRYFRSIVLIFGLSHYFLTFNQTKRNFRFVDHPNMGLWYKILVDQWIFHVILALCQLGFWFLFWLVFYLPHTYGIWGKYWFSDEKNEIFFHWFSVFRTFYE